MADIRRLLGEAKEAESAYREAVTTRAALVASGVHDVVIGSGVEEKDACA